jgi:hypothetical protein
MRISELISGNTVLSHIDVEGSTPPQGSQRQSIYDSYYSYLGNTHPKEHCLEKGYKKVSTDAFRGIMDNIVVKLVTPHYRMLTPPPSRRREGR